MANKVKSEGNKNIENWYINYLIMVIVIMAKMIVALMNNDSHK